MLCEAPNLALSLRSMFLYYDVLVYFIDMMVAACSYCSRFDAHQYNVADVLLTTYSTILPGRFLDSDTQ